MGTASIDECDGWDPSPQEDHSQGSDVACRGLALAMRRDLETTTKTIVAQRRTEPLKRLPLDESQKANSTDLGRPA